jgi:hypothetical protein
MAEHFSTRVTHYEIWNEPNGDDYWQPNGSDPAEYAGLVRLTAPCIRQRVPGARIIGGAIAGGTKPEAVAYVEKCLEEGIV